MNEIRDGFPGTVGNTPLIRIRSLSRSTGCEILGKAEFLNPGGSVKDRAALAIVASAEKSGALQPGGTIVEGTAGNTGIGLAHVARARGYACLIVMPNNLAQEKTDLLRALGAELVLVPPAPFASAENYYHVARRFAEERKAFWANQFENPANYLAHYQHTGPEILRQADKLDGFVCAAGTGGTIGGITSALKEARPGVQTYLVDCEGSSLYPYVTANTLDVEGSSIMEGIGIRRITHNFAQAKLDGAFLATDKEAVAMAQHLLREDGLFLGGSAALNCVGAVKLAAKLGAGKTIVTILCDGGGRYQSKLYNEAWLREKALWPTP
jgi:cysteine synthase